MSVTVGILTLVITLQSLGWTVLSPDREWVDPAQAYYWTPPTAGSPVEEYRVQACAGLVAADGDTAWTDWTAAGEVGINWAPGPFRVVFRVRAAAVDSLGRQGPWSEPSDPAEGTVGRE